MASPSRGSSATRAWLRETRDLDFDPTTYDGYDRLWRWSCDDLGSFWQSIWDCFGVVSPTPHRAVLAEQKMPGAVWFPGAQVNYAQHVFGHADAAHGAGHPAIVFRDEAMQRGGTCDAIAWPELRRRVASLAAALASMGVAPGDRVAAFLPNGPRPRSRSSPVRASARSGRSARPTWGRSPSSTASARSPPRC
jgi:acetoacetyl-CoA synthetase